MLSILVLSICYMYRIGARLSIQLSIEYPSHGYLSVLWISLLLERPGTNIAGVRVVHSMDSRPSSTSYYHIILSMSIVVVPGSLPMYDRVFEFPDIDRNSTRTSVLLVLRVRRSRGRARGSARAYVCTALAVPSAAAIAKSTAGPGDSGLSGGLQSCPSPAAGRGPRLVPQSA